MTTVSKPVRETSAARERILMAAHDLFYREGIRATGVDRVIAEAGVTKATFYRHFPSKNDLIREFLDYRHQRWLAWFADALRRHGGGMDALVPAMAEWFADPEFRGCAFINSIVELAGALPEVAEITRRHKQDMEDLIASLLPSSRRRKQDARDLAVAVDGAIIRAQFDVDPDVALASLDRIRNSLSRAGR